MLVLEHLLNECALHESGMLRLLEAPDEWDEWMDDGLAKGGLVVACSCGDGPQRGFTL